MEDGRFSPMALESLQVGTDTTHKGESVSCWLPAVFAKDQIRELEDREVEITATKLKINE